MGRLDWRLDFDTIERLALAHPNWSIVLIGRVFSYEGVLQQVAKLRTMPNVYLLGRREFQNLPQYVAHFDVCTIPYRIDESTNTMRIYKVCKYLAVGKPVVSTDLFEMRVLGDVIRLAPSAEEFVRMVEEELDRFGREATAADRDCP